MGGNGPGAPAPLAGPLLGGLSIEKPGLEAAQVFVSKRSLLQRCVFLHRFSLNWKRLTCPHFVLLLSSGASLLCGERCVLPKGLRRKQGPWSGRERQWGGGVSKH